MRQRLYRGGKQFVKFSIVGASGVLVNLVVFNITILIWHAFSAGEPLAAKYAANLLGFLVSVLTNYWLNRHWTFRSSGDVASELPKFLVVSVVAYAVNLGVFSICLTLLHAHTDLDASISANIAQLIAIAGVMPINFIANKLWSFRSR